jgi:hypothetical protein
MSARRAAGSGLGRLAPAWRQLPDDRRLAAGAAVGLFIALFLPWYQETVVAAGKTTSASLTGWAAFSVVEAVILLLAAGVLTLLFRRAEAGASRSSDNDGSVIVAMGGCTCALIVWRILDKQGAHVSGPAATASGVEWGIFVALAAAALLTYAGSRIRRAGSPEPPAAKSPPTPAPRRRERSPAMRLPIPEPLDPPTLRLGDEPAHEAPADPDAPTHVGGAPPPGDQPEATSRAAGRTRSSS